jgi:phage-related protein
LAGNLGQAFAFTVLTKLALDMSSLKKLQEDVSKIVESVEVKDLKLPRPPAAPGAVGETPGVEKEEIGEPPAKEMKKGLAGLGEGIKNTVGGLGGKITGFLKGGIGNVLVGIGGAVMGIFSAMAIVSAILGNQFSGLKQILELFSVMLQLYLKPFADMLFVLLKPVLIWMIKLLPVWYKFIADPVEGLKGLGKVIADGLGNLLGVDLTGVATWFGQLLEDAGPFIQAGLTALKEMAQWIGTYVVPLVRAYIQAYVAVVLWIGRNVAPLIKAYIEAYVAVVMWIATNVAPLIKAYIEAYVAVVMWIATTVAPLIKAYIEAYVAVVMWIATNVAPLIKAYIEAYVAIIMWIATTAGPLIKSFIEGFVAVVKWIAETVAPYISLAFAGLIAVFALFKEWGDNIKSAFGVLADIFSGIPDLLRNGLKELPGKIITAILDAIPEKKDVIAAGKEGAGGVVNWATGGRIGDAIIKPDGQVIHTSPRDWLFAMEDPNQMKKGGGQSVTVNMNVHGLVDATTVRRIADEVAKETRRRISA